MKKYLALKASAGSGKTFATMVAIKPAAAAPVNAVKSINGLSNV